MPTESDIAVIGMSGRFPGAQNIKEFWENICNGIESIQFFSDQELLDSGIDSSILQNPAYVKAKGIIEDIEYFDALFFGYTPREAEIMDPQHRIFLEEAYNALEDSGYDTERYKGSIGVFAGCDTNTYLIKNLLPNSQILSSVGGLQLLISNEKNHLITRLSYKFNLTGPGVNIQSACSTSLVAIHFACQSLLNGECDMALCGGISLSMPSKSGYIYENGMISSPDGHCRPFDYNAKGTVSGNGVGVILLKPLDLAIQDRDNVYAVIKGSAVNNDGSQKASYTAPGIDGQANVIAEAIAVSGVSPESIQYIEANATGNEIGDAIEFEALNNAFKNYTDKKEFCAIGSVKSNIGHLNEASGIASFIKTVCILKNEQLPPSINYEHPNRNIDFSNTPFYIANQLKDIHKKQEPMRAGVSAFGIGGTNAHIILEEAPVMEKLNKAIFPQLLLLSAKTKTALGQTIKNLIKHLENNVETDLADIAYTLKTGRKMYNYRCAVVCNDIKDAIDKFTLCYNEQKYADNKISKQHILFEINGNGLNHISGYRNLYQKHFAYAEAFNNCTLKIFKITGISIEIFLQDNKSISGITYVGELLLNFACEYSLAELLQFYNVVPKILIGSGVGHYVSACLAEVVSFEDAILLLKIASDAICENNIRIEEYADNVSAIMENISGNFISDFTTIRFYEPKIAFFSQAKGDWVRIANDINNITFWLAPLFNKNINKRKYKDILENENAVLKENPIFLVFDECEDMSYYSVLVNLSENKKSQGIQCVLETIGKLWTKGVSINWENEYKQEKRYKVSLPTYAFERQYYWIKGNEKFITTNNAELKDSSNGFSNVHKIIREDDILYVPPVTDTEKQLEQIWKLLFGLENISVYDNFFEIGGHSLLAINMMSSIRNEIYIDMPIELLYENPTISSLAEIIDVSKWFITKTEDVFFGKSFSKIEEGII